MSGTTPDLTYQVVLNGIQPGKSTTEVSAKFAALFKATSAQVDAMLAAKSYVLKKGVSPDVAANYKKAIEAAGGMCKLVTEEEPFSLDIELPNTELQVLPVAAIPASAAKSTVSCIGCGRTISIAAATCPECGAPQTRSERNSEIADVSAEWKKRFALIEKAGGVDMPNEKGMPRGERLCMNYNKLAFFFGPFYYVTKGMWKRAVLYSGIWLVLAVLIELIFHAPIEFIDKIKMLHWALHTRSGTYFFQVIVGLWLFYIRANIDYYKKMVLGDNGWW
jgi:predicted RNA-binding Zn-ribbon protein involved in translation (DUF1610 family)